MLRIRLLPMSGFARIATLQVNCALGKVPDEHPTEGVRLSLERGMPFEQEVSGRTMFLVTRPEPKPAEKSSAPKPSAPDSPGVESEPNTTRPKIRGDLKMWGAKLVSATTARPNPRPLLLWAESILMIMGGRPAAENP